MILILNQLYLGDLILILKSSTYDDFAHLCLKGVSTVDAVTCIVNYFYDSFEEGKCVVDLFLYFAKMFSTLNRIVLFAKLENYGIKGCELIG